MPNPNPVQTAEFEAKKYAPIGEMPAEPLGSKAVSVKVGQSVEAAIFALDSEQSGSPGCGA